MATYFDSGARFDESHRYSGGTPEAVPVPNRKRAMKKVKLVLEGKDNEALSTAAKAHGAAADNPANGFTGLTPSKTDFDDGVEDLDSAILARKAAEAVLATKVDEEATARAVVETLMRGRAGFVDNSAKGDATIIHKAAFEATAEKSPVGALPAPENLRAALNGHSGQMRVRGNPVKGAGSYVTECREHGTTLGPWQQVKVSTSASFTATGLTPGKEYAFRMKAVGSAGDSPWSDEVVKMAV